MSKINNIIEGWVNVMKDSLGLLSNDIKELSEERLKICSECEHRKHYICGSCGCPLISKVKSKNELCPKKKWKK